MRIWAVTIAAVAVTAALGAEPSSAPADSSASLICAARNGALARVEELISLGAVVNARDADGRTALHYAAENGHMGTVKLLLEKGANPEIADNEGHTALYYALKNHHEGTAGLLSPARAQPSAPGRSGQSLSPALKYPDLESFQKAIGEAALMLKSKHVQLFAAKRCELEAGIVFPYLVKAYDELRRITGVDTEYVIVVYNFPKGHSDARGGTSGCTIWYDDSNLQLDQQEEWKLHRVPHVSGYIEEMAHNFVSATRAQFGWEMIGWSIGAEVASRVAGNPVHSLQVEETRKRQADTYRRYLDLGFTFPADIPANLVDRIHAHILWQCEQKYGKTFWPDFFSQISKRRERLLQADFLSDSGAARNERYRVTLDCFDSMEKLQFKKMLTDAGISVTIDVKSLHPTDPGWNRKLQ